MERTSVFRNAELKKIIESRFKRWKVREIDGHLIIESTVYKIRKPSREYEVGWRWDVSIENGAPITHSLLGWNAPKYAESEGYQNWAIDAPPAKLKTKVWDAAWPKALEKLHKKCELDIVLPNGLMARWDPWTDSIKGWGEVPKVLRRTRLNRGELSWEDFLAEQVNRHGPQKRVELQKALILLREPHPGIMARYETKESKEYKERRRQKIKMARAALEEKNGTKG
jgi:hypothetical protein